MAELTRILWLLCVIYYVNSQVCTDINISVKVAVKPSDNPECKNVTSLSELQKYYKIHVKNITLPVVCRNFVKDLPELKELDFSHLGVVNIKANSLVNIPQIQVISLSNNNLTFITGGVFSGLNVQVLYLNQNAIFKIYKDAFNDMPKLRLINLDSNNVAVIDTDWFKNCPKLHYLSFYNNAIEEVPERAFRHLEGVKENPITIVLSSNHISNLSQRALAFFPWVKDIYLDDNFLKSIPEDVFEGVQSGVYLNLVDNNIVCLSKSLLEKLSIFQTVSLVNNPISDRCVRSIVNVLNKFENPNSFIL